MFVRLRSPVAAFGFGQPSLRSGQTIEETLARVDQCNADLRKAVSVAAQDEDFGERLKKAVQEKVRAKPMPTQKQHGVAVAAAAEDESSFAEKLKRAVQKHPKSKDNEQKRQEEDRARYQLQPRKHTKSD